MRGYPKEPAKKLPWPGSKRVKLEVKEKRGSEGERLIVVLWIQFQASALRCNSERKR